VQKKHNFVYLQATHIEEVVTHVFVSALQNFRWMGRGWIDASHTIKTELCVAHFFPNPVKSAAFTNYVHAGQRVLHQESMGEDKSKTDAKQSELFYHGRISSRSDLISTVCNLIVTFDFMIADMDSKPPFFLQSLEAMLDAIQGDSGRDWMEKHSQVDHLFVALAAEFQQILLPFINLATNTGIRRSLKSNQPLSYSHFVAAKNVGKSPMERVYDAITMGTLGTFRDQSTLTFLVSPESSPSKKHVSSDELASVTSPPKKSKKEREPHPKDSESSDSTRNLSGLLKFTKQGRVQWPVLLMKHPKTGENARLCGYFLFKGKKCTSGTECRRVHLTKLSNIPDGKRNDLLQYVNDTDGVEFTVPPTNNQGS
jgi:hypothetical protein